MEKQPEKYTHPERYQWYLVKTDKGIKQTFAKSKDEAKENALKRGFVVYFVVKQ